MTEVSVITEVVVPRNEFSVRALNPEEEHDVRLGCMADRASLEAYNPDEPTHAPMNEKQISHWLGGDTRHMTRFLIVKPEEYEAHVDTAAFSRAVEDAKQTKDFDRAEALEKMKEYGVVGFVYVYDDAPTDSEFTRRAQQIRNRLDLPTDQAVWEVNPWFVPGTKDASCEQAMHITLDELARSQEGKSTTVIFADAGDARDAYETSMGKAVDLADIALDPSVIRDVTRSYQDARVCASLGFGFIGRIPYNESDEIKDFVYAKEIGREQERLVDATRLREEYERRYPEELAVLRIGGVYPGELQEGFTNPYTGELDREYFGNVGEHCIAVAYCAEVMAKKLFGANDPRVDHVVRRALVHDATKRYEVMRKKALKAGMISDAYSTKAYETIRPLLVREGIPSDIVDYMAHAGEETGHISFTRFVEITNGTPVLKKQDNISDIIVHLADDMTFTPIVTAGEKAQTTYLTVVERMRASDFPKRYPFLYTEGFGFDPEGNPVLVKDVASGGEPKLVAAQTYAAWQPWIAGEMASYLVEQIAPTTLSEHRERYLKNLVRSSLE